MLLLLLLLPEGFFSCNMELVSIFIFASNDNKKKKKKKELEEEKEDEILLYIFLFYSVYIDGIYIQQWIEI